MTAALLRTVDNSYVIETGVPVGTNALVKINVMTNRWKHYILWFGMGSIWGFLTQLAAIGLTYLGMMCEVDHNMWFGRSIVAIITIVCVTGPFLLRLLVLRFVAVATVRTNVDTTFLENVTKSFVVFSLFGSSFGVFLLTTLMKEISGLNTAKSEALIVLSFCINSICAVILNRFFEQTYELESESKADISTTEEDYAAIITTEMV